MAVLHITLLLNHPSKKHMQKIFKSLLYLYKSAKIAGISSPILYLIRFSLVGLRHGLNLYTLTKLTSMRLKNEIAISDDTQTLTWHTLMQAVNHCIVHILNSTIKIKSHSKIIIYAPNTIDLIICLIALSRLGVKIILCPTRLPLNEMIDSLAEIKPDAILVDETNGLPVSCQIPLFSLQSFSRGDFNKNAHIPILPKKMGQLVVFSSGTTGKHKAIPRQFTLTQLTSLTYELISKLGLKQSTPTFITVPVAHGYGLASLSFSLALGAKIIISSKVDGNHLVQTIASKKPEILLVVPKLLERIIHSLTTCDLHYKDNEVFEPISKTAICQKLNNAPIRTIVTGSEVISELLVKQTFEYFGPVLFNLYGSTEAGIMTMATPDILKAVPTCVGLPLNETYISIQGSNQKILSAFETGEIVVSSALIFNGYQLDSKSKIYQYNTHDLGYLDDKGYLHLIGRN